ncbi:glycine zipper family protein [Oxalobacteraceae bacterium CAVE-383]|nr:glycine zipper family protein [Oxalobacteraceae bacterium CAVE-383]
MQTHFKLLPVAAVLLVAGCTTMPPTGPQVMVMPGAGKSYEQFRQDEALCQQYASQAIGNAVRTSNDSVVNSAAVGTVVGAAAGALIGAASGGNAGSGAAIGAGGGLLMGSAAGSNNAAVGGYNAQRRYDNVYVQCMYTKGNQVPVRGDIQRSRYSSQMPPPPAGYVAPPGALPPSGYGAPPDYAPPGNSGPPPGYR